MADYSDLIERLQKAQGPDRSIDLELGRLQGVLVMRWSNDGGNEEHTYHRYTESIDAALTLFGEHIPRGLHLYRNAGIDMGGKDWGASAGSNRAAARSWPLALCILRLQAGGGNG